MHRCRSRKSAMTSTGDGDPVFAVERWVAMAVSKLKAQVEMALSRSKANNEDEPMAVTRSSMSIDRYEMMNGGGGDGVVTLGKRPPLGLVIQGPGEPGEPGGPTIRKT